MIHYEPHFPFTSIAFRLQYFSRCNFVVFALCRGAYVQALGKQWHSEHFACSSCGESLKSKPFVEHEGKMFCETCYKEFFASRCSACSKTITGVSSLLSVAMVAMFYCDLSSGSVASSSLEFHMLYDQPFGSQCWACSCC